MDQIVCEICLSGYSRNANSPITLNCGHTFCSQCVKILNKKYPIICGKCRAPTSTRYHELSKSYMILDLLERLEMLSDDAEETIQSNADDFAEKNVEVEEPDEWDSEASTQDDDQDMQDYMEQDPEVGHFLICRDELFALIEEIEANRLEQEYETEFDEFQQRFTQFNEEFRTLRAHLNYAILTGSELHERLRAQHFVSIDERPRISPVNTLSTTSSHNSTQTSNGTLAISNEELKHLFNIPDLSNESLAANRFASLSNFLQSNPI